MSQTSTNVTRRWRLHVSQITYLEIKPIKSNESVGGSPSGISHRLQKQVTHTVVRLKPIFV